MSRKPFGGDISIYQGVQLRKVSFTNCIDNNGLYHIANHKSRFDPGLILDGESCLFF